MGTVVVILVIAAIIGGVMWNKRNAAAAVAGVEFDTAYDPSAVGAAIRAVYCGGTKAMMKSMFSGLTVSPVGTSTFKVESRLGDIGEIIITARDGGALVCSRTVELYVGSHPKTHFKRGIMGIAAVLTHKIYQALGVTPGAARMKGFQRKIEGRVARELSRSTMT